MKWRGVSLLLLAMGVLCGITFALLNLSGVINTRFGELMMYGGIITLAIGLVLFGTTSSKDD